MIPTDTNFVLHPNSQTDPKLQAKLEHLDETLRSKYRVRSEETAVGLLDLKEWRLAWMRPDSMMYGASVPKLAILLSFFDQNPDMIISLPTPIRHELGLMIKQSSNEMATKFSRKLGLRAIQRVLNSYGFYDPDGSGGIWMGKHYGENSERIGDPISNHSHAATVRQLLRFYLLLEQGKLISEEASARMREIFDSPEIPHDAIKFVKGLRNRKAQVRRKWGSWENWLHDSAVVQGESWHYILVGLTNHPQGDEYLATLAESVDSWMV